MKCVITLDIPMFAFVVATRVALGVGVGLLVADACPGIAYTLVPCSWRLARSRPFPPRSRSGSRYAAARQASAGSGHQVFNVMQDLLA